MTIKHAAIAANRFGLGAKPGKVELRSLGVFWLDDEPSLKPARVAPAHDVYVTRRHLRCDAIHLPE